MQLSTATTMSIQPWTLALTYQSIRHPLGSYWNQLTVAGYCILLRQAIFENTQRVCECDSLLKICETLSSLLRGDQIYSCRGCKAGAKGLKLQIHVIVITVLPHQSVKISVHILFEGTHLLV